MKPMPPSASRISTNPCCGTTLSACTAVKSAMRPPGWKLSLVASRRHTTAVPPPGST